MVFGLTFGKKTIADLERRSLTTLPPSKIIDIKSKIKAVVIDDESFPSLENLRRQNYKIVFIGNTSLVEDVSEYDIVICDIRGVAQSYSPILQGGGFIAAIKKAYPEKYVIVYSGSFKKEPSVLEALAHANEQILKSASTAEWSAVLDDAISWVANPVARWRAIRTQLEALGVSAVHVEKLENAFVRAVIKNDKGILEKFVQRNDLAEDTRAIVRSLLTSAIWSAISA